jgi:aminoglycoside phosphotransferase (APT) family kinase protein
MTHGDLIPGKVLVSSGRLTGIIDVGGMGRADRALDLGRAGICWSWPVAGISRADHRQRESGAGASAVRATPAFDPVRAR